MDNLSELQAQAQRAQEKLDKAKADMASSADMQYFAENLHNAFCRLSHEDFCGWEYEKMENGGGWAGSSHKKWMTHALDFAAEFPRVDYADIVAILKLARKF